MKETLWVIDLDNATTYKKNYFGVTKPEKLGMKWPLNIEYDVIIAISLGAVILWSQMPHFLPVNTKLAISLPFRKQ